MKHKLHIHKNLRWNQSDFSLPKCIWSTSTSLKIYLKNKFDFGLNWSTMQKKMLTLYKWSLYSKNHHTSSMSAGGGFKGIWPRVNLLALNWFSSSGVRLPWGENRLSDAPSVDLGPAAGGAPNPPLVCPKVLLLLPGAAGVSAPKPLPNPPPAFAVEEKLNPEAEPNPEVAAGVLEVAAPKEKDAAERAEEEEPNPVGGWAGAVEALPKPVEDDGAAEESNPPLPAAKLKALAWAGAGAPKPTQVRKI